MKANQLVLEIPPNPLLLSFPPLASDCSLIKINVILTAAIHWDHFSLTWC